jgi:hypothetical protein
MYLADTPVQRLGGLIGTLLQLPVWTEVSTFVSSVRVEV